MIALLRHLLTGRDNATHDLGRWSWFLSFMAVLGHSIYAAYLGHLPSVTDLAQAFATIAGGHGLALWAKRDTEPGK